MTDEHSKDKDNQELADYQFDEEMPTNVASSKDDLDHLQDDFNTLLSESRPNEEATDAFNDLADAFAPTPTASTNKDQDKEFSARLDESFNAFAASSHTASNLEIFDSPPITDDDAGHEDIDIPEHLDDRFSDLDAAEYDAPVHADLSAVNDDDAEAHPRSKMIALALAILIATAGGVYWYSTDSTEESGQNIPVQSVSVPSLSSQDVSKQDVSDQAIPAQTVPSEAVEDEQVALPESAQPPESTQLLKSAAPPYKGSWVIVAPVASQALGQQYVTNFKAKHIASEVLRIDDQSKVKYVIRIKGFTSKKGAQKRSERLATSLGLHDARILKATDAVMVGGSPAKTISVKVKQVAKKLAVIQPTLPVSKATVAGSVQAVQATDEWMDNSTTASRTVVEHKAVVKKSPVGISSKTKAVKKTSQLSAVMQVFDLDDVQEPTLKKPQRPSVLKKPRKAGSWTIVAPVDSNKTARQYAAYFAAKHMNSEIMQINEQGKVRYFIRVMGFASERSAQKRRDRLVNTLGLKHAKVEQQ